MEMLVGHIFGPIRMGVNDELAGKRKCSDKVLNQWSATRVWSSEVRQKLLQREINKESLRQLAEENAARKVAATAELKNRKEQKMTDKEQRAHDVAIFAQSEEGINLAAEASRVKELKQARSATKDAWQQEHPGQKYKTPRLPKSQPKPIAAAEKFCSHCAEKCLPSQAIGWNRCARIICNNFNFLSCGKSACQQYLIDHK